MTITPTRRKFLLLIVSTVAAYLLMAYVVMPQFDRHKSRLDQDMQNGPHLTHTGTGLPGDPLNIALIGSEQDILRSMAAAGWHPADALTFRSSVKISIDTVFKKPDDQAPVSNLYLFGRKEDLAFEKPVGNSPKQRHHVRFWKTGKTFDGRPVWIGSAAFDIGVELSRTTGQVTHHISADVDAERDLILGDLSKAGLLQSTHWIDGFQQPPEGKNGGGDPWHSDGRLAATELKAMAGQAASKPE
jgi:hypothetical protein